MAPCLNTMALLCAPGPLPCLQSLMSLATPAEAPKSPVCGSSKSLQSKLLEKINSLSSKDDLLAYVEHCHHLLDTINLATVLYRLARLYSFIQAPDQKSVWKTELLNHPAFALLLRVIHSHLVKAQSLVATQAQVPGLNARCMSNLLWSIVKLEVTAETEHEVSRMALDLAFTSVPLVLHFLPDSTGQGLGNMLWSYARIPDAPSVVLTGIVARLVDLLEVCSSPNVLDAQALSNTLWSIAHLRSQRHAVDELPEWQHTVTALLLLAANHCINLLQGAINNTPGMGGSLSEGHFSYQAMTNVAWSFSMILGSACGVQDPVKTLFLMIRQRALGRLQAIVAGAIPGRMPSGSLAGSFNEQALSHLVQAFQEAQLLTPELLQAVFDVAAIRLGRAGNGPQGPLGFKPEELGILLKAVHLGVAQPRSFLLALNRLVQQHPEAVATWPPQDALLLHTTLQLLTRPALTSSTYRAAPTAPISVALPTPAASYAPPRSFAVATHLLQRENTGSTSSGSLMAASSAPQPAFHRLLTDIESANSTHSSQDPDMKGASPGPTQLVAASNRLVSAVGPTSTPALPAGMAVQQVWVVNSDGLLQPINLLVQQPLDPYLINYL